MREDGGDVKASRAFDIHKEAIWTLNQPLELVLGLFFSRGWVKEISGHDVG